VSELVRDFERLIAQLPPTDGHTGVELVLRLLDPVTARYVRLCAIPHYFSPSILAALAPELDLDGAEARCNAIGPLSFVMVRSQELVLHETARKYLFSQWLTGGSTLEFQTANQRMAAYFEQSLAAGNGDHPAEELTAHAMFHRIGANPASGFEEFVGLFRQARHDLRLSQGATLIRLVHEYDQILPQELRAKLTYYEGKLASDRRDWKLAEDLLASVVANGADPTTKSKSHFRLGFVYAQQRDWTKAIEAYKTVLERARSHKVPEIEVRGVLTSLAQVYRDRGDLTEAKKLCGRALELASRAGDRNELATIYNTLGTVHLKQGDIAQAVDSFQKSLSALKEIGDRFGPASIYNNLGMVYAEQNEWQQAMHYYQDSLLVTRQAGDTAAQARTLNNLARVNQGLDDCEKAIENYEMAVQLFTDIRDLYHAAETTRNLARLYLRLNRRDDAGNAFKSAAELFDSCESNQEANATRLELQAVEHPVRLPWWSWTGVAVLLLVVLLALMAIRFFR